MKQWDIFSWEFPEGKHPAVIVSHPARIAVKPTVNVLLCSSQRARRVAEVNEVIWMNPRVWTGRRFANAI